ncbi:MAG: COG1361 S-layer family protein [Actinomycetota bacterium]
MAYVGRSGMSGRHRTSGRRRTQAALGRVMVVLALGVASLPLLGGAGLIAANAQVPTLTSSKSGPATVAQGGTVNYTISVSNTGTTAVTDVRVFDQIDANLTNISASASQGSCAIQGNLVRCDIGTIAAGGGASVSISATAPTGVCPTLSNTAEVKRGFTSAGTTNTVVTDVTGCTTPDVSFSKSGPATVAQGGTVTYTISVSNTGNGPSLPITVTDSVDAAFTNVQASTSQGNCSVNGNNVSCSIGVLAAGGSATVTITATAPTGTCPDLSNAAQVQQGNQAPQSTNTVTTTVTGCAPDVSITKSASAITVAPGGSFTYSVTVTNNGAAPAQSVVVTDTVPAGLTIGNVTGPNCSVNGQTVTCNVGTLAAGASATITISVTATAQACPSVSNTAHVSFQGGPGGGSADSNAVAVGVTCTPGVSITKSASAVTVASGGSFSYTVQVSNTGSGPAQNVVVTDTVPAGLTIGNVTGPNCSVNGQTVTCNVGTLAAGATATITISVTATAGACPSVVNRARVTFADGTGGNGSADSNPVTVGVNCETDVQIVKNSDAPGRGIDSGDSFTYSITVSNDGSSTAEGVVVTDTIPDGLEIDGVSGPNCSVNGQVVTCNVGDLAAGASITITIDVTADDDACPAVENFAHVEWNDGEETSSEDSNTVVVDVDCVGGETVTPTPPPDDTTTITPPGGTAFTGPDEGAVRMGLLSIALLVLGTGLTFAGYRRRARNET